MLLAGSSYKAQAGAFFHGRWEKCQGSRTFNGWQGGLVLLRATVRRRRLLTIEAYRRSLPSSCKLLSRVLISSEGGFGAAGWEQLKSHRHMLLGIWLESC